MLWARLRSWLTATLRPSRMEREMDAELNAHVDLYADDLVRSGVPPEEAHRRARAEFGAIGTAKEDCRDARGANLLPSLLQDLDYGLRILRKNPAWTALIVATLAIGVGATTAVFSLLNGVLLRALPYRDPGRLVFLYEPIPRLSEIPLAAWGPFNADFYEWQRHSHSFTSMALFTVDSVNLATGRSAVRVSGSRVTADFFSTLGVAPELGRWIEPGDDQPGAPSAAVISHAMWQSQFGSDRAVLGRQLLLNAQRYRIVGVMPAGFAFPHGTESLDTRSSTGSKGTDVWMAWAMPPEERASHSDDPGVGIARLRPGVAAPQAEAELNGMVRQLDASHPPMFHGSQAAVRSFDVMVTGTSRRALLIFMAAVVLVLLIACSNVASLVLARAGGRSMEFRLRTALGASRGRLIRQLSVESLWLAGIGGLLGVGIAWSAMRLLIVVHPADIPRLDEVSMDGWVLLFALGASILTAFIFGVIPAISASRYNLRVDRTVGAPLQRGLMIGEVALTFVLLAGSGLLIRSFVKLQSVDKGFAPSSTVTMHIQLDERYGSPQRQTEFFQHLLDRAGALPGVKAAGVIDRLPLSGGESMSLLKVEGFPFDETLLFQSRSVTPGYFGAMGIPLVSGRAFTANDTGARALVAIVNRSFASKYFPGQEAIGKRFQFAYGQGNTSPWWTIVGVAGEVRQASLETAPPMQIYGPFWQSPRNSAFLVVRTALAPDRLAGSIRWLVRDLDSAVAVSEIRTMERVVSDSAAERRFQTLLVTLFGFVALFLSLVGLYAVMAYSVQQRVSEIGVRMALGAQPGSVLRLVIRQGSTLALAGIAIGAVCAWVATRSIGGLLFETSPLDVPTFLGAAALFFSVAVVACYGPARRASRVDPAASLRCG